MYKIDNQKGPTVYSKGNYTQYYIITYKGKESVLYTWNLHDIVNQLYFNKNIKKKPQTPTVTAVIV